MTEAKMLKIRVFISALTINFDTLYRSQLEAGNDKVNV